MPRSILCGRALYCWNAIIDGWARSSRNMGLGREAVTYAKQRNIIKAASAYLTENGLWDTPVRFDVAEVDLVECGIEYIKNAFQV